MEILFKSTRKKSVICGDYRQINKTQCIDDLSMGCDD